MRFRSRLGYIPRLVLALVATICFVLSSAAAQATPALTQISSDPYSNPSSSHRTEVEPDTFSYGNTIVSAFQVGRFYDGGATNVGWSTSPDGGNTWIQGFLPGITKFQGGTYDRVSDAAVAYDARHNVWLVATLPIAAPAGGRIIGSGVLVSRSLDGGLTWHNPVTVVAQGGLDKSWIVCDNHPSSPYYGNCYVEYDDNSNGNLLQMSTSTDGGLTWGAPRATANNASGLGGQPLVQQSGRVVVPAMDAFGASILSFTSSDGGQSWSRTTTVTSIAGHRVAGNLRSEPLPSAEIDASGKVYVAWQDCRFRRFFFVFCRGDDIVMSTSLDGSSWSPVVRVPIDATTSGADHFIPGLAVDPNTAGATAHLGLAYYYYPQANCTPTTCQLNVGFVSSTDGGAHWSAPTQLAGPMSMSWLPLTSQGYMVGDYISTSFVGGRARPVIAVAQAPSGGAFNQAMYTPTGGLAITGGTNPASADGAMPGDDRDPNPQPPVPLQAQ